MRACPLLSLSPLVSLSLEQGRDRKSFLPGGRTARVAAAITLFLGVAGPTPEIAAAPVGFTGQVSSSSGLEYGSGGALVAVTGDLLEGSPLDAPPATPTVVGSFVLQSAGTGDLRSSPGTATLTTPSGDLVAVATHVNGPTLRDATTGVPLAAPAGGPGPSAAAFTSICSTTLGSSAVDRSACLPTIFSSTSVASGLPVATIFSHLLAGDAFFNTAAFRSLGASQPLPLVNLQGSGASTLSGSLTPLQQGLLGCGSVFGTNCDTNGIGSLTLSAGTAIQSFASIMSQPGTVGFVGGAFSVGGRLVVLPGSRGPGGSGYNPAVDGNPAVIGFDPVAGNPGYQTPGQPFTGQAWQNVLAGFSWNLLMMLVTSSPNWDRQPLATASTTQCSYFAPQLCLNVQSYLRLAVNPLADDPNGTSPRWLWETGADYTITQASGEFAGLLGDGLHAFGPFDTAGLAAGAGFLIDVVPEPSTALLFGVGLAGLARTRRERV